MSNKNRSMKAPQNIHNSNPGNGLVAVLSNKRFAWFFTGTVFANAASWIHQVTISWIVYDLTSSGVLLGTINLVGSIAMLLVNPIAGITIDRYPKRTLYLFSNIYMLSISFGLGLLLMQNKTVIWFLFLFSFLSSAGKTFTMLLQRIITISIPPSSLAHNAVAVVQTGWALMRSIGPAIAGILMTWFGPSGNYFIQAFAYALVIFTIFKVFTREDDQKGIEEDEKEELGDIWNYIKSHPYTLTLLLLSCMLPLLIIPNFSTMPPIYAKDVYQGDSETLGIMLSVIGIGGVIGGFISSSLKERANRTAIQYISLFLLSLSFVLFALSRTFWVAMIFILLAGTFETLYVTTNLTLLLFSVPESLRGRLSGIENFKVGLIPVGGFLAGIGTDYFNPRHITIGFACVLFIITLTILIYSSSLKIGFLD